MIEEIEHRAARGMKILTTAAVVFAALILAPCADAASSANRERSDEVVKTAEANIYAAGRKDPLDSAKMNRAIDELRQALKIDPRNDSAYVDLGFCYGLLGDGSTAEDMYRTATLINPSPANYKELADVYLRTGNFESALMAANAGLQKDPRNAKLYNAKGMALNDLTRTEEAAQAFRRALVYDPSFEVARRNLQAVTGKKGSGSGR
jgi:Tfp pilus assembly protein PilF